ncbi:MAG: CCXG family PEP-CTERM protein [Saccharospirillaceae bacterium]|nr:CCXG family PEP-CTERM protein [Saccharospirillaceae bacterium]MCD8533024.1 CCXG family PEP-CTERM protein [Saccharospirillaceae bacterium]
MRGWFWLLLMVVNSSYAGLLCDWPYRTEITLSENSGSTLTNYQILLRINGNELHPSYNWTSGGNDLRILDQDDSTEIPYYIDNWNAQNKSAEVWIKLSSLPANSNRKIYLYYGKSEASPLAQVPPVFDKLGIRFHTRSSTVNPDSKAEGLAAFNSSNDNNSRYGCTFINNFTGITNRATFNNGNGSSTNIAAYSQSYFEVKPGEAGVWAFRYGADFGRGGGLYVDGQLVDEDWTNDLWWEGNWSHPDVLYGTINLSEGYHKIEIIGSEGGNDGGITAQFCRPTSSSWACARTTQNGNWRSFSTTNIDIRSYSCPISEPTVTFGAYQSCSAELSLSASPPALWVSDSARDFTLNVSNNGPDATQPDTLLSLTLGGSFQLSQVGSSPWNCSLSSGSASCTYSAAVASGEAFNPLTLSAVPPAGTDGQSFSYSGQVSGPQYDSNSGNNTVSGSVAVRTLILPAGRSCTATSGLWTRFFNTQGSSVNYPANATQFQSMVDTFANENYLDGQTLFNQVNGSGNPFDSRGDEYYLTIFDGYLYVPTDGDWWLAVDGDDALEMRLNDTVRVSWYDGHGALGGPNTSNDVRLGLARGYHKFEFRHQEYTGGDVYRAYWSSTTTGAYQIIPAANFSQCDGIYNLQLDSTAQVISDPVNGNSNPKAIPGAVIDYSVRASNVGTLSSDPDTTVLVQAIAADSEFYAGTDGAISPVTFVNGTGNNRSGLTFAFSSLTSTTDGLEFSSDGGNTFNYQPSAGADGFDAQVTHFRLILNGTMNPALGNLQPYFDYQYRVRLH